jgi:hypothetical protein
VAPRNDDFENAQPIEAGPRVEGTITGSTRERGEPVHARRSLASHSVWYRFRPQRRGTVTVSTCPVSFDSVIAIYTGRSLRSTRLVDHDDNSCYRGDGRGSLLRFTGHPGRTYRIAVAGTVPRGEFRLKVALWPAPQNDDFVDAIPITLGSSISATNQYALRELGEPGHGSRTVWFRFAVTAAREVRLQACNGSSPFIAVYTGRRVDRLTRVAAIDDCLVQFRARRGVMYRVALFESGYKPGRFRLRARIVRPPANDDFANAPPVAAGTVMSGTLRGASREDGEPVNAYLGQPQPFTVWYRLTIAEPAAVAHVGRCPGETVVLGVYTGDQVDRLSLVGYALCDGGEVALEPGSYSIQLQSYVDAIDFKFTARAKPRRQ